MIKADENETPNEERMMTTHYAIVTFGPAPTRRVFRDANRARRAAARHAEESGATTVRIMECDTKELAKTADVSVTRTGERMFAIVR